MVDGDMTMSGNGDDDNVDVKVNADVMNVIKKL
jgi:hypothetical protein